jgi:GNAT superfamily N-acetyltransferase
VRTAVVAGAATRDLRRAVLRPGWPCGSPMHGDDNPDAVHLAAIDDQGVVIGSCIVLPRPYPVRPDESGAWQLRGMATTPAWQGKGVGGRLLAAALDEVRGRDGRLVWCEARTTARAFYAKHGFTAEGPEFDHAESGLPHYRMWLPLAPPAD